MFYSLRSKTKKNVQFLFLIFFPPRSLLARARQITSAVAKAKKFKNSLYTKFNKIMRYIKTKLNWIPQAERNTYRWDES